MPTLTSAPGSKPERSQRGFTLIELLVVLVLVAIATASAALALRDPAQAQLQREGERLVALIETARAEARASGLAVQFRAGNSDSGRAFEFNGLPQRIELPTQWLGEPVSIDFEGDSRALQLGPEPLLPPQSLRLRLADQQLRISSDGLRPFAIQQGAP